MNKNEERPAASVLAPGLSRRGLLKSGLLLGAAASLPATARAAGNTILPAGITAMSELEYRVLDKLRVVLLPVARFGLPSTTEVPVMANLDDMIGRLNAFPRTLLRIGLHAFEYGSIYKFSRFSQLDDKAAYETVEAWQSGISVQRGLMSDIKTLVTLSYWRDPRTWTLMEYDGPVTVKWGIRRLGNAPLPRDT